MKQGILGIFDIDEEYANHLMEYLNRKVDFVLEARVFTNRHSLINFLEQSRVDVLLAADPISTDIIHLEGELLSHIKNIMVLSSGNFIREGERYPVIYKFQSTENVIKEIMNTYLDKAERIPEHVYVVGKRSTTFISVFSPCGGSGTTTTTFLLGQLYGEGKKVLIINWELFPGNYGFLKSIKTGGFSELMYYVKAGKQNLSLKLNSLVQKRDNIDYLMPADHYEDLCQLEKEDVTLFLEALKQESGYDIILFDIGFLTEAVKEIFYFSSKIFMPHLGNKSFDEKKENMKKILLLDKEELLYEKIYQLNLPYDKFLEEENIQWNLLLQGNMAEYLKTVL